MKRNNTGARGFTLIELLLVISIIALLSSIVFGATQSARKKALDARRVENMTEVQKALELYRADNTVYPSTADDSGNPQWWTGGNCQISDEDLQGGTLTANKGYGADGYIQGLVPKYIQTLPEDPAANLAGGVCYSYKSDGDKYMISDNNALESADPNTGSQNFDRPSTSDNSIAVYSDNASGW